MCPGMVLAHSRGASGPLIDGLLDWVVVVVVVVLLLLWLLLCRNIIYLGANAFGGGSFPIPEMPLAS